MKRELKDRSYASLAEERLVLESHEERIESDISARSVGSHGEPRNLMKRELKEKGMTLTLLDPSNESHEERIESRI